MFRIVLFEPEIPPNTGNVIRLCANTGAELHLVKPLGFDLDKRSLRRAGLDYRWMAAVHVHADFAACREALTATGTCRWWAVETGGTRRYDEVRYAQGDALLFGSERRGLPAALLAELRAAQGDAQSGDVVVEIPMREGNRSLNLSNAVTLVTYEAWRQNGFATVSAAAPDGAPDGAAACATR
jgi:tRNA (cytidine/uridine-2'-O-)-methyltransferase